jgi:hypothetical protein
MRSRTFFKLASWSHSHRALLELMFPRDGVAHASGAPSLLQLQDALAFEMLLPTTDVILSDFFVQVAKTRQQIVLSGDSHASTSVRFDRLDVVVADNGKAVLERSGQTFDMDIAVWSRGGMSLQLLRELKLWVAGDATAELAPKRQRLGYAVSSNASRAAVAPLGVHALPDSDMGDEDLDLVREQTLEASAIAAQEMGMLALLDANALRSESGWRPALVDLPGVHAHTLDLLSARGIIERGEDEFGDHRFALVPAASEFRVRTNYNWVCGLPARELTEHLNACVHPRMSTLELAALCVRAGWRFGAGPRELTRDASQLLVESSLFGIKWFWVAVAAIDLIWAKGFDIVYTQMPATYYEFIFYAKNADAVRPYGDAVRSWRSSQWLAMCQGVDPLSVAAVDENPRRQLGDGSGDEHDADPLLPVMERSAPLEARSSISGSLAGRGPVKFTHFSNGKDAAVLFDGSSHTSGMPRAFVVCSHTAHVKCEKYRFLHHFASVEECVSWLAAWGLDASCHASRDDHYKSEPSSSLVEYCRARCPQL